MTINHAPKKAKMRRMKQMEGLLMISRPKVDEFATTDDKIRVVKPKRTHVMLQPQQLQLAYSAQEDQEMNEILGRIDLDGAKLEQAPDGFLIHSNRTHKKFKLHDKDKAAIDAWFYAVYAAITEFERSVVEEQPGDEHVYMAALTNSFRDEASDLLEFELSCQLVIPTGAMDEPSLRWKVWKTSAELQILDESLRSLSSMVQPLVSITYPRERKRDSLFGGLRKKIVQELRQQQLSQYIEKIFSVPEISSDPDAAMIIRDFLRVDTFFHFRPPGTEDENPNQPGDDVVEELPQEESYEGYERDYHHIEKSNSTNQDHESYDEPQIQQQPHSWHAQTSFGELDNDLFEEVVNVEPVTDPVEAKKLHKAVINIVRNLVGGDGDRVREFQDQTKDFGRGRTEAKEYCAFLLGAIGAKECCALIPMMAHLLPDDEKRQELLAARTAIVKRKQRRSNRKRSKQFSESVALQQFRLEQHELQSQLHSRQKLRPKSDGLALWSQTEQAANFGRERATMTSERRNSGSFNSKSLNRSMSMESGWPAADNSSLSTTIADNRKFGRQTSQFELSHSNEPIEEEINQSSWDEHNDVPSAVKSMPHAIRRLASQEHNPWVQRQAPQSLHSTYGQRVTEKTNSNQQFSHHQSGKMGQEPEVTGHDPSTTTANMEENPVLARLRKQGAVNFMLR